MKKKILSLAMAVCLVAVAVTGFTLAYFTDEDSAVNTMVSGSVKIEQNETDGDGNAFKQGQKLIPAVFYEKETIDEEEIWVSYNGKTPDCDAKSEKYDVDVWENSVKNVIDKFVTVTNTGSEDAYVRTLFLLRDDEFGENNDCLSDFEYIRLNFNTDKDEFENIHILMNSGAKVRVTVDGVKYCIWVATYKNALGAGKTTVPSLCQLYLTPTATQDWYDGLNGTDYKILALSQAVQAKGFDDATTALDIAFGEVTPENVTEWFSNLD